MGAAELLSREGEAEAKLDALFAEARRCAPALLFLDEVDASPNPNPNSNPNPNPNPNLNPNPKEDLPRGGVLARGRLACHGVRALRLR